MRGLHGPQRSNKPGHWSTESTPMACTDECSFHIWRTQNNNGAKWQLLMEWMTKRNERNEKTRNNNEDLQEQGRKPEENNSLHIH